jgi:transposase InsO family protein
VYVAFAIDVFSRKIVGGRARVWKETDLVLDAIDRGLRDRPYRHRPGAGKLVHHSDAGSQYTPIRYTDTLALEGMQPSIGSVGDAYDNAAAETVMGLFKNEAAAKDSPFRSGALKTESDVMEIVFEWVHWYNNERLHSALDHQPPEEYEQTYYDLQTGPLPDDAANKQAA